jgi:predicted DsbA family dithiol-disulfide isomerase
MLALCAAVAGSSGCRDSSAGGTASIATSLPSADSEPADVVLAGVDISAMTPRERREWNGLAMRLLSPCPSVPVSVAECVREKRACEVCLRAARWVARAVREGASDSLVERAYRQRFDPSTLKSIAVDGSPTEGPDHAPVTIVDIADFECPHCREVVPRLDALLAAYPGRIRVVYKAFVLSFHQRAEPAARAAFAAGEQGKFWEMEHVLFEQQQRLEDADLERYAKLLKLDLPKWKAGLHSPQVDARLEKDRQLGRDLNVQATPTLYINGRELDVENGESLEDRVAEELGASQDGSPPAHPPAGSASDRPAGDGGRH